MSCQGADQLDRFMDTNSFLGSRILSNALPMTDYLKREEFTDSKKHIPGILMMVFDKKCGFEVLFLVVYSIYM